MLLRHRSGSLTTVNDCLLLRRREPSTLQREQRMLCQRPDVGSPWFVVCACVAVGTSMRSCWQRCGPCLCSTNVCAARSSVWARSTPRSGDGPRTARLVECADRESRDVCFMRQRSSSGRVGLLGCLRVDPGFRLVNGSTACSSGSRAAASRTSSLPVTTSAIRRVRYSRRRSISSAARHVSVRSNRQRVCSMSRNNLISVRSSGGTSNPTVASVECIA